MARLRPQPATSLVDRVTHEIKESILAGGLHPGEQFSIAELCEELDVSHIPVREALRRLEGEGLVVLRPGKSAIVTPLSLEELEEIYTLRLMLEPTLAGRSASQYTAEQLELLEQLCEEEFRPNYPLPQDAHRRFHELLVTPASGPHASVTLKRLWDAGLRYVSLVYDGRPQAPEEPYRRHLEIVEAAKLKRAPAIRKALADHLSDNKEYMLSALVPVLSGEGAAAGSGDADTKGTGRSRAAAAAG